MESSPSPPRLPHVLVVSFPGQGNVNPFLHLAKLLASHGLLVTFSSTLYLAHKLKLSSSSSSFLHSPIPIADGVLRFDFFPDAWDVSDPRHNDFNHAASFLLQLRTTCPSTLSALIRRQSPPVSTVIYDPFVPWVADVAHNLTIPSALLWIQPAAVFSTYYHYFHSLLDFPSVSNPNLEVIDLPGLPPFKPDELPTYILPSNSFKSLTQEIQYLFEILHKSTWVLLNSFQELEFSAIEALSPRIRLIPIGPLACNDSKSEIRGNLWRPAASSIPWLDSQSPKSVVFVSVGSNVTLKLEEMGELANGLMDCGRPFLWVVRDDSRYLLPDGFLEEVEVEGKGKVVSWISQEEVLAHESVACFLSHCGWNSTTEALSAGVPVICYPYRGDQVPNAKFIVEEYGVGVRLEAPLKREGVVRCVSDLMGGGEVGERVRRRALEWKEAATKAVGQGGSSDRNVAAFVEEIVRRAAAGGGGGDVCCT